MLRKLKNIGHRLESTTANLFYKNPSKKLTVIGVTGTDGKTTTANLIHHILTVAGYKTALLSTISSAHTTTPGRGQVHKFLARSVQNGCTHAVMEVTSIGVDQHRVAGIKFAVGVLTNIAQNEHLDYHKTFENYRNSKLKFLLNCPVIIANADDPSITLIEERKKKNTTKLITYGIRNHANITPKSLRYTSKLIGEFNTYNTLAAISACQCLGVDNKTIIKAITTFEPPAGRLEIVVKKPYLVIVDFAHTPQAFEKVLPVARSLLRNKSSRLIHVFGATGDRDREKRPIMAKIASKFDDFIFITHEDTYSEDPKRIMSQLEGGLKTAAYTTYQVIPDRREAISMALKMAKSGDVVILTGVGHQKSMNIGGKEVPWSEKKTVLEILNK